MARRRQAFRFSRYDDYEATGAGAASRRCVPWPSARPRRRVRVLRLKKSGHTVAPVQIAGRKIATTFWGTAWCDNLERYSDFANRIPRGRTYVRNGSVIDLQIEAGRVAALVSGSSIYHVSVKVAPVPRGSGGTSARAAPAASTRSSSCCRDGSRRASWPTSASRARACSRRRTKSSSTVRVPTGAYDVQARRRRALRRRRAARSPARAAVPAPQGRPAGTHRRGRRGAAAVPKGPAAGRSSRTANWPTSSVLSSRRRLPRHLRQRARRPAGRSRRRVRKRCRPEGEGNETNDGGSGEEAGERRRGNEACEGPEEDEAERGPPESDLRAHAPLLGSAAAGLIHRQSKMDAFASTRGPRFRGRRGPRRSSRARAAAGLRAGRPTAGDTPRPGARAARS